MSVSHHPADAILADYASGGLRPGFDLVVAAHLESCPGCRRHVRLFESAAGAMLEGLEPSPLPDNALSHLMGRIEREPSARPTRAAPRDMRPLVERLPVKGRRWLAPGLWVQPLDIPRSGENRAYFLRVPGGMRGLEHGHTGSEFTTVVKGALRDGDVTLRAGDFCETGADDHHQPESLADDGGCLCLIATEGRLQTRDLVGAIVRAVTGV